jgi:cytochrome c oxidase subunit 4
MNGAMIHQRIYIFVWAALIALTAATWQVSFLELGVFNTVVALSIASVKAALVALYFMHLRHENRLVLAFAIFPLFFLALIILGTLADTLFR